MALLSAAIIRNRTFFFGAYEGRRYRRANQQFATLPDPQWLLGDFSNRATPILDPFNNNQPFPNNVIPQSRISSIARNYNQYIPAPNTSLPQGNFAGAPASTDDLISSRPGRSPVFQQRHSLRTLFLVGLEHRSPGLLPFRGLAFPLDGQNVVIQETHIFGTATVNNLKLGYSRGFLSSAIIPADRAIGPEIGLKNLSIQPSDYSSPSFGMAGFSALGFATNTFRHWTNTYAVSDTLALTRGRHNFSLGGDVRHHRTPQITTNAANGSLTFTYRFTGFSVPDYVLGTYSTANAVSFTTPRDFRFNQ